MFVNQIAGESSAEKAVDSGNVFYKKKRLVLSIIKTCRFHNCLFLNWLDSILLFLMFLLYPLSPRQPLWQSVCRPVFR
jgi:hypothetical protein